MKRILLIISMFLIMQPVMAKNIKVEAMSDFSTVNPPTTWRVKIVEGFTTDSGLTIHTGSIIEGKIEKITSPKRLKRAANFTFIPQTYYDSSVGYTKDIKEQLECKYSPMTDITAKSVAKTGAITAGNIFISGFIGPSVALVEGAVKNEEGNRAKSAAVSVYESSPLSYAQKGKELDIKKGQVFIMSFKLKDEEVEDEPNYTYEVVND